VPLRPARPAALVAAIVSAALVLTGCSVLPGVGGGGAGGTQGAEGFKSSKVSVQPLYVKGSSGGVAREDISVSPSKAGDTRIDFSENEVSGFGDMTRAASWNAVTVATLLTGAPLGTDYRFAFDGAIDGPSAGGLTTVGVLSLYFGDQIDPKATMTGAINPTGTIGVVGGIPEKIQGVIDGKKIKKVLIPAGQRNTENEKGDLVDVVALGQKNGVKVVEVGTISEAYKELTGKTLPSPSNAEDPKIGSDGYDKMKSGAGTALADYDKAYAQYAGLNPAVQSSFQTLVDQVSAQADDAKDLGKQGLQAGSFVEGSGAAVQMQAVYNTANTIQNILVNGFGALDAALAAGSTAEDQFTAELDRLGTYKPKTLTDVEALVSAYGLALDAYSLLLYAEGNLNSLDDQIKKGQITSVQQLLGSLLFPLILFDFAQGQLTYEKALFDIGRDNGGAKIVASTAETKAVGDFFRRAADANWAAFESGVIQEYAKADGVSNDVFRDRLGNVDLNVALSYSAQQTEPQIADYIGSKNPNAAYAAMGYGWVNYARNANHLEKYYNNGVLDENLNVTGVRSDTILSDAIDNGRAQVAKSINVLKAHKTEPVIVVGQFELAGVEREQDTSQKFDAIEDYAAAFTLSRAMAFLGGYPADGWKR
jgi:uncharacterized protein